MNASVVKFNRTDVLLIDQHFENASAFESLKIYDHLILARSFDEALQQVNLQEPAVIVLNANLNRTDHLESKTQFINWVATTRIPLILLASDQDNLKALTLNFKNMLYDVIYLPLDPGFLKMKVDFYLDILNKNERLSNFEKMEKTRQKHLDLVQGVSNGIVWSINADDLSVNFVSPSAQNILGYSLSEWAAQGESFLHHVHPDDRGKVLSSIQEASIEKKILEINHRLTHANGQEAWLHTGLFISPKEDGTGDEVRGLSVEITKTKEAEQILRLNKKHSDFLSIASLLLSESLDFNATLPSISKLIVPTIADWCIIHMKDGQGGFIPPVIAHFHDLEVKKMEQILGEYKPILPEKAKIYSNVDGGFLGKIAKNETELETLQSFGLKSAMSIPLVSNGTVYGTMTLFNGDSKESFHPNDFLMAQDLARRMMMAFNNSKFYEQAQNPIRVRDEFLSVASHELKTPLTPLKLQIQMLIRMIENYRLEDLNPERLQKMLQTSNRQLGRLTLLIDELLDSARINSGNLKMNIEEFNLGELFSEVLDRFEEHLSEARCNVIFDFPQSISVRWDRFRMEQVITNILANSLKYGVGQPIFISARTDHGKVNITIKDRGIGIAKKDHERIFMRFEKAVPNNHFPGLGLGLYVVNRLIEAHFGTISVDSELGCGATFTLSIPQNLQINNASEKTAYKPFNWAASS